MKLPVVSKLASSNSLELLLLAEQALYNGEPLPIEVDGADEGEQLTHLIAAIWILNDMEMNGNDLKTSLRLYTKLVRDSIV